MGGIGGRNLGRLDKTNMHKKGFLSKVVGKFFVCSKVVGISKVVGTAKAECGQACTSGT